MKIKLVFAERSPGCFVLSTRPFDYSGNIKLSHRKMIFSFNPAISIRTFNFFKRLICET